LCRFCALNFAFASKQFYVFLITGSSNFQEIAMPNAQD